jgi:3-phytase
MNRRSLWLVPTLLACGCGNVGPATDYPVLTARIETDPVKSSDDAADDPAIWVNVRDPGKSLIMGTDKKSGLMVFGLNGRQLQYLPVGQLNNIDLRPDPAAPADFSILAASARNPSLVVLFRLDHATGQVTEMHRHGVSLENPYGICMSVLPDQSLVAVVTSQDGTVAHYVLDEDNSLIETRRYQLDSQPEGCVVDDRTGRLFIGEEDRGIWSASVLPNQIEAPALFADVKDGALQPDIEGLTLLHDNDRTLLLASSQGDNSYAIYDVQTNEYQVSFRIGDHTGIDGTEETDGIDATTAPLPGYPRGLLVVQDGLNTNPDAPQNFKYISLADVFDLIP